MTKTKTDNERRIERNTAANNFSAHAALCKVCENEDAVCERGVALLKIFYAIMRTDAGTIADA